MTLDELELEVVRIQLVLARLILLLAKSPYGLRVREAEELCRKLGMPDA